MEALSKEIPKEVVLDDAAPKPRRQPSPVNHWPTPVLLERAAYLRKLAKLGDGSALDTLREYPQHTAMLLFRARSSEPEVDATCATVFYVLAGNATLVTGARAGCEERPQGREIENGTRQELRVGDIVHIPAGISRQILISGEKTITCLIFRIQQTF